MRRKILDYVFAPDEKIWPATFQTIQRFRVATTPENRWIPRWMPDGVFLFWMGRDEIFGRNVMGSISVTPLPRLDLPVAVEATYDASTGRMTAESLEIGGAKVSFIDENRLASLAPRYSVFCNAPDPGFRRQRRYRPVRGCTVEMI